MSAGIKGLLGIGSIILGGWTLADSIKQKQQENVEPIELIDDFDCFDEYGEIPQEQRFTPDE